MTHTPVPLTFAEEFAGIAGFGLGFHRAGMTPTFMGEIEAPRRAVLARHFPGVPQGGDINDTTADALGRPDLICGGFPCKDTSVANSYGRLGLAGQRSGNFFSFARLLDEHLRLVDGCRPRWVVIENPVGLLTSPGRDRATGEDRTGWDMAAVVRGLEDLGYGWAYRVVDGRHFGAPQRRERVIVVGHRGGDPRPAWQVLGDTGASGEADPAHRVGRGQVGPTAAGSVAGDGAEPLIWRKSARARASLAAGGYETWVESEHSNTLTGFDAGNALRQTHLLRQHGRVRTLTVTEWERLGGFPDGWTEPIGSDVERMKAVGDSAHPGMTEWLGRRLMAVNAALPLLPERVERVAS